MQTEHLFVAVDHLDRGRQLVGVDPNHDLFHVLLPPASDPSWDGEVGIGYYEQGNPFLSHASSR